MMCVSRDKAAWLGATAQAPAFLSPAPVHFQPIGHPTVHSMDGQPADMRQVLVQLTSDD
jgi:hypothetical protein